MSRLRLRTSIGIACMATAVIMQIFGGCKRQEKRPESASSIVVESRADGIHLKTAQAEFVLTSSGTLLSHLRNGTQWLTLDEAGPNSGVLVTSGKQTVNDFLRDLGHAEI